MDAVDAIGWLSNLNLNTQFTSTGTRAASAHINS